MLLSLSILVLCTVLKFEVAVTWRYVAMQRRFLPTPGFYTVLSRLQQDRAINPRLGSMELLSSSGTGDPTSTTLQHNDSPKHRQKKSDPAMHIIDRLRSAELEKKSLKSINKSNKSKFTMNMTVEQPELLPFQRIVHYSQIPKKRGILCRIAAKGSELLSIARQCGFLYPLDSFQANITLSWKEDSKILVEGKFIGKPLLSKGGIIVRGGFDTLLLCNHNNPTPEKFSKTIDCDDEVDQSGNIDIGQIAVQYFDLEMA